MTTLHPMVQQVEAGIRTAGLSPTPKLMLQLLKLRLHPTPNQRYKQPKIQEVIEVLNSLNEWYELSGPYLNGTQLYTVGEFEREVEATAFSLFNLEPFPST
jgi:hypothetical protein